MVYHEEGLDMSRHRGFFVKQLVYNRVPDPGLGLLLPLIGIDPHVVVLEGYNVIVHSRGSALEKQHLEGAFYLEDCCTDQEVSEIRGDV